jgi:hypothetical protein
MSHNRNGNDHDTESGVLIWILLIVLLLGGIGTGGYFVLRKRQAAVQAERMAVEVERAARDAEEAARKAKAP